jgi:glycosyltransferase involved in cell wall biosynthesis
MNRIAGISDLPACPPGRTGWPWTQADAPVPDVASDGKAWPKITIVTPSFNQGQFIEETIRSVLLQGYPNLEYIIIDGGSTDNSVGIIRKYEPWLTYWVSEPDHGQSHALNKGFSRATGELIGWQNSDDWYCPHAFEHAAVASKAHPERDIYHGITEFQDANGAWLYDVFRMRIGIEELSQEFPSFCAVNPAIFYRRHLFDDGLTINESYHYAMDAEFLMRVLLQGAKFQFIPQVMGCNRVHGGAKTQSDSMGSVSAELAKVCEMALSSGKWPKEHLLKAAIGMRNLSGSLFRSCRMSECRSVIQKAIQHGGYRVLDARCVVRYLLSNFGTRGVQIAQWICRGGSSG